ncbi:MULTISPECIES: type II toxin-antitoxin system PemK/MazF family toxin [unclassified Synechococcus]|uniref:type II toxin-antitoxin system PemK/MazF family toxin n=1 Tax=unclassified Synechococcus TaxID=2626047 RepID=UPI0021A28E74|nr:MULTISPECIES: type II toxin-antitoxin system PemK/MazF family toxin [unclassified Synechococcus]MCT0213674.1 type II toxin-antitoxin system PemK/MazF family toxin [Synechococcus sp. CS-1326]MCT0234109.1 type II toxin-antitoxin system PemK/MazF family toxin [Synechococcus sp. CS-1327]
MAERGRIYRWPRNRSFGDTKARPVLVISPEAAHHASTRRVVVPLSRDPRLNGHLLGVALDPSPANGLHHRSYAMAWHPTTVDVINLEGPLGRITPDQLADVLQRISVALDLGMQEPWQ